MNDRIELMPVSLIAGHCDTVSLVDETVCELNLTYGWHYILDFVWLLENVKACGLPRGAMILDAGAGLGVTQFCLARLGFDVTSVDFSRRSPSLRMLRNYRMSESGELEASFDHAYLKTRGRIGGLLTKASNLLNRTLSAILPAPAVLRENRGRVILHRADLRNMSGVPDASMDAVVSVSALEHNSEDQVTAIMKELNRVLKPGAPMFITTSASGGKDWFHEPSKGWCYSEESLRRLFLGSHETVESNYSSYETLMQELRTSAEMKARLHPAYFKSGNNGMPWGKWNPGYYPVGLVHRRKAGAS